MCPRKFVLMVINIIAGLFKYMFYAIMFSSYDAEGNKTTTNSDNLDSICSFNTSRHHKAECNLCTPTSPHLITEP
jgi:hypothetical protein